MGECFSMIRGRALRATRLDSCGSPIQDSSSVVVTKGFISVALTADTQEGDQFSLQNANGEVLVADVAAPTILGYGVEVHLCGVNPDLISLLTGQPVVADGDGVSVGFRANSDIDAVDFALELWSEVPSAMCEAGVKTYGYLLLPFISSGVIGDFTVENAAVNFSITGAHTREGSNWRRGPYDVVLGGDGQATQLTTPIDAGDHLHVQMTRVPPPDPACDPISFESGFGLGGFGITPFGGE